MSHEQSRFMLVRSRDAKLYRPEKPGRRTVCSTRRPHSRRAEPERVRRGSVEGALNVPLDDLRAYTRTLEPDTKIVTYCGTYHDTAHPGSSRGEAAADLLVSLSLDAKTLAGGLPAWRDALLPVEIDDEPPKLEIQLEETQ